MHYQSRLIPGTLIRRYKRFLADVALDGGGMVTAHCPNSGSMLTCATPGWPVFLSTSDRPGRKYPYTWEMVHNGRCWIGINTQIPNIVAAEAITDGGIAELPASYRLRREISYGANSRIDILLEGDGTLCYVEVKNVTLVGDDGAYCFPDARTARGLKHLEELTREVRKGARAVMLYIIQRNDGTYFRPAGEIAPDYARALRDAAAAGVEVLAYLADVSPSGVSVRKPVPVRL